QPEIIQIWIVHWILKLSLWDNKVTDYKSATSSSNFHPVKFKPIEIKTNFSQYTNSGLNFKITLGGTNTTNPAFRYSTYIYS
ncbi:hypothetical protein, partial [Elizabethkingia meningoseptica]|uniref:hypothetical protein n=1 Tax=Elizabethkingia meningoseptica TaxID=238 RepID=UPI003891E1BE